MEKTYSGTFDESLVLNEEKTDLFLKFDERSSGGLQIFADGSAEEISLSLEAEAYSYVKIFFQNSTEDKIRLQLQIHVKKDARIRLGFLDLSHAEVSLKMHTDLDAQGATMEFYSGQLCQKDARKYNDIEIVHHSSYTYGNMHNFAVTFGEGYYDTVAAGRIDKGCSNSESHQETRVLTMGKDHMVKALPILYIDENDVKASHALSVGQPDADQLYYLQSRGLSKEQSVGLLSVGYFMPVIDLIEDKDRHEQLREEMERRVGLYEHS